MDGSPDLTDDEIRAQWRAAGGKFHGPNVEHGSMPESKLLPYLRTLLDRPGSTCTYEQADPGPGSRMYLTTCGKEVWIDSDREVYDFCPFCGGAVKESP